MSAIIRKTQKDIGNYEAKLIGPFTSRQVVCIGIGVIPTFIGIWIARGSGADPMSYLGIAIICMAIPCFFAFGQKFCYGMKPENFLADYIHYHQHSARIRLYKTKTYDDVLYKSENQTEIKTEAKKKKGKNNPEKPKQIKGYHYYE